MSCACRAVPWRTFVRGLAQVHRLEGLPQRPSPSGLGWAGVRQRSRLLHSSQCWGQDAVSLAVVEDEPRSVAAVPSQPEAVSVEATREESVKARTTERTKPRADKNSRKSRKSNNATDNHGGGLGTAKGKTSKEADRGARARLEGSEEEEPKKREAWQIQKAALKEKFPEGWKPRKRLSPDALAGIRALNAQFPEAYTTEALAKKFAVSAEAIRRILKSKWQPSAEEEQQREDRWFKRGMQVWERKAALGVKPPKKWRMEGIARDPSYHEWSRRVSQREREWEEEEVRRYREQREAKKRQGT